MRQELHELLRKIVCKYIFLEKIKRNVFVHSFPFGFFGISMEFSCQKRITIIRTVLKTVENMKLFDKCARVGISNKSLAPRTSRYLYANIYGRRVITWREANNEWGIIRKKKREFDYNIDSWKKRKVRARSLYDAEQARESERERF